MAESECLQQAVGAVTEVQACLHDMLQAIPVLQVNIEHSNRQHAAIVKAVLAGEPTRARRAMEQHCDDTAALLVRRDEQGAKQWLQALGVPVPKGFACVSHAEVEHAFGQLAKPVVLKILSSEIQHKTDVGGVQLNIVDERGLNFALARLDRIPLGSARSYLLEEMAPAGFEVIVGAVRDPSFGPSVMLGAGGIFAEALKDSTSRLAPLTLDEAEEMIGELRVATIFEGWRGGPALDKRALARVIVTLGRALCRHGELSTVEINPLRVYPEGVLALDALLV